MSAPALSIIIPAFNAERYIAEAMESALRQTLRDFEIIVVDDGSTDRTWHIASDFMDDARVRGVRQLNQGIASARNTGLAIARGEFVAFLDADDRWFPDKALCHVSQLRCESSLDLSFSWYAVIDASGNDTGRRARARPGTYSWAELLRENLVWNGMPVMRRSALQRVGWFDGALPSHEDFEYVLRVAALRDRNVACIPRILVEYRRRPGQLTANWQAMHDGWLLTLERMRARDPDAVAAVEAEATARHYRYLAYLAWEARQPGIARAYLWRAWRAQPVKLARDHRAWLTTAAVFAQVLPSALREPLIRSAEQVRAQLARPRR